MSGPDCAARLFARIDFSGGVLAAVSGGSDSTALLVLLKDHLDQTAPSARLMAATVDHGLRTDSATEAAAVAQLCARLGVEHRILRWSGSKPVSGLPAAAREARYRLLDSAARQAGIGMILTGHTADDQAETVLMRQARNTTPGQADERQISGGESGRGLAGMASATLYDGKTWIGRPFLGARRETLRDLLRERAIGWADDPTNADKSFERPRLRAMLSGAAGSESLGNALATQRQAAILREDLGRRAASLIERHAIAPAPGLIRLDPGFAKASSFAADERAAAIYVLRLLLSTTGGIPFLPEQVRVGALYDRLADAPLRATLSRTVIDARRAGIFLYRERRGLPKALGMTESVLWDSRRRITLRDGDEALLIAPLGLDRARLIAALSAEIDIPQSLACAALASEPALWRGGEYLGPVAMMGGQRGCRAEPVAAPWVRFLPGFDLAPCRAVNALIGGPSVPSPPCCGPIDLRPWPNA